MRIQVIEKSSNQSETLEYSCETPKRNFSLFMLENNDVPTSMLNYNTTERVNVWYK